MEPHALSLKILRPQRTPPREQAAVNQTTQSQHPPCHLGETFSGLALAINESTSDVILARIHVDLQTPSAQIVLADVMLAEGRSLKPGETIEANLLHEIKEPGPYTLACYCSYIAATQRDEDKVERTLSKGLKFQATNPLSVKTKVHSSKLISDQHSSAERHTSYLEVQVQNIAGHPLTFQKMDLEPAPGLEVEFISNTDESLTPLQSGDTRQYLYVVKALNASTADALFQSQKGSLVGLGRLDIVWVGPTGEIGRLQTAQLSKRIASTPLTHQMPGRLARRDYLQYTLSVLEAPRKPVEVFQSFDVTYNLRISPQANTHLEQDVPLNLAIQTIKHGSHSTPSILEGDLLSAAQSSRTDVSEGPIEHFPPPLPATTNDLFHDEDGDRRISPSDDVITLGSSLLILPRHVLQAESVPPTARTGRGFSSASMESMDKQAEVQDVVHLDIRFTLSYVATRPGLLNIGGLRLFKDHHIVCEWDFALIQVESMGPS